MNAKYLVILNDQVIGEFTQLEDAQMYQYINALGGDEGDKYYIAKRISCMEVVD